MNNDLESLFRSSFESENISEEDWNVPSDRVWTGIEKGLTQKKERRLGFFWILPFAMASGLLTLFLFKGEMVFEKENSYSTIVHEATNVQEVDVKNTKIEIKDKVQTVQSANIQNKINENGIIGSVYSQKYTDKNTVSIKKKVQNTAFSFENTTQGEPSNQGSLVENKSVILPNAIAHEKPEIANNATSETSIEKRLLSKTLVPISQDFKYLTVPVLNTSINYFYAPKLDISPLEKVKKIPDYALLLSAQTFFMKNKIKSNDKVDFSGEKFNLAYSYGISATKMLGKHTFINLGLQKSVVEYSLNYSIVLPFNSQGETTNINGNFDNQYSGAIPTSQGELKMQMILQRQSQQIVAQGEAIPLSASGMEKLTFLRIPFSIGANFLNIGKFQIINQLSFNQMINTDSKTTFQNVSSLHNAVQETQTVVSFSPKPSKWTPEIGTSLGVYYPLTKKIYFGAEGFFNQSLRPIYKNSLYSNTPISYGIGANLKYSF